MKVIVKGRQEGKTHDAVEWVKRGEAIKKYPGWSRVILTINLDEAARLRREYNLDYHQVFSVDEWTGRSRYVRGDHVAVVLDNADLVLQDLLGPLAVVTLNDDLIHEPVEIWQERPGEFSYRCSCGMHMKHQQLGTHWPKCSDDRTN